MAPQKSKALRTACWLALACLVVPMYAYMALFCYDMGRYEEFMKYLQMAVEQDPNEAKAVLSCLFPEGTPISDYVTYMERQLQQNPE